MQYHLEPHEYFVVLIEIHHEALVVAKTRNMNEVMKKNKIEENNQEKISGMVLASKKIFAEKKHCSSITPNKIKIICMKWEKKCNKTFL